MVFEVDSYNIQELYELVPELSNEDLCLIAKKYEQFGSFKYEGEPEWLLYEEVISTLYKNNETILRNVARVFVVPELIEFEKLTHMAIVAKTASKYKREKGAKFSTYLNEQLEYDYINRINIKGKKRTVALTDENDRAPEKDEKISLISMFNDAYSNGIFDQKEHKIMCDLNEVVSFDLKHLDVFEFIAKQYDMDKAEIREIVGRCLRRINKNTVKQ